MIAVTFYLMILFSGPNYDYGFYEQVAARCNGEASFSLAECAATVRNRLKVGWAKERVLEAYYAPDMPFTDDDVETVRQAFENPDFHPDIYFMLGKGIDDWYRPHNSDPILVDCKYSGYVPIDNIPNEPCVLYFTRFGD